tara:strand:- start:474 stop:770 length:297 start_codon:yes stop_codon:yes gene_type:complete
MTHKHNDMIKIGNSTIQVFTLIGYCDENGYDYEMMVERNCGELWEPLVNFGSIGGMITNRTEPVVHYERYSVGDTISIDNVDYIIEPQSNNNFIPIKK